MATEALSGLVREAGSWPCVTLINVQRKLLLLGSPCALLSVTSLNAEKLPDWWVYCGKWSMYVGLVMPVASLSSSAAPPTFPPQLPPAPRPAQPEALNPPPSLPWKSLVASLLQNEGGSKERAEKRRKLRPVGTSSCDPAFALQERWGMEPKITSLKLGNQSECLFYTSLF